MLELKSFNEQEGTPLFYSYNRTMLELKLGFCVKMEIFTRDL